MEAEETTELLRPLPHARDPHSGHCQADAGALRSRRHSPAVISDLDLHDIIHAIELDFRSGASGVPVDVGERFLDDAEQRHLDLLRQVADPFLAFKLDTDSRAAAEGLLVPFHGLDEAD